MSSIIGITPNLQQKKNNYAKNQFAKKQPSFGKTIKAPTLDKLVNDVVVNRYLGKFGSTMKRLTDTVGEIQNIIFIGFGTAFIAPIFIAFNPIAKQDEKTKKYSALRQPISAIIATAVGLGINIPVAKAVEKWSAEGRVEKFDTSAIPSDDYMKTRYQKILKNFDNLKGVDKEYFDMLDTKDIKSKEEFLKKYKDFNSFSTAIKDVSLSNAAKKLLDSANPNALTNMTVRDFLIKNMGFELDPIDNKILNVDLAKSKLQNTTAMEFLKKFGYTSDEINESKLRTFVNENFYKSHLAKDAEISEAAAKEFIDAFENMAKNNNISMKNLKEVEELLIQKLSKCGFSSMERKTITRLAENLISEEMKNKETISMKNLFKVLDIHKDFHKNDKLLNMSVVDFLKELHSKMNIEEAVSAAKSKKVQSTKKEVLTFIEEHTKEIAKNFADKNKINFKAYKNIQGIALSLLVLPFSCGFLNWSYPRIMEKLFPSLVDNKSAKKAEEKGGK